MGMKENIIREVRMFEFYSKWVWPLHRRLARKHLTARCRRCILPESYTPLVDGLCPQCRQDHAAPPPAADPQRQERMQQAFDYLMQTVMVDTTRPYHVMLLFSGGKDSSYMLYRLIKDYPGLRLLAVTVDNTFMSPVAMENIHEIIRRLGVAHMIIRPKAATMERMYRYAFLHLNDRGCSGTVDQFDGDFFSDLARNLAAQMNIPYILCGLTPAQVENILGLTDFITDPVDEARAREQVAGIRLRDVFNEEEMKHWWNGPVWPAERRPRMIFPFYIWDLQEAHIKQEVLRLGLMPRGDESPLITNHRLIPLMGIVDMAYLGYSSFEPEFAGMIRKGKAQRRQWLYTFEIFEYAARTGRFLGSAVGEALTRLSLSPAEVGLKHDRTMLGAEKPKTIGDVLDRRMRETPRHAAFWEKTTKGRWRRLTWKQFHTRVDDLARCLFATGVRPGDHAAILMPNTVRWEIIQHALLRLGAVVVGLDLNDPVDRMRDIFSLCRLKYLFTDHNERLNRIPGDHLGPLRLIVCEQIRSSVPAGPAVCRFDELAQGTADFIRPTVDGEQKATVIFTSGTTGSPKRLSFSHRQLLEAMTAITTWANGLPSQARTACWLPLANTFQRMGNLCALYADWQVFMVSDPSTIMSHVRQIAPHLFTAVPRFYEKLHTAIEQRIAQLPAPMARAVRWAKRIGRKYHQAVASGAGVPQSLKWRYWLADRMILKRVRGIMGGNLRYLLSGSAPAGASLLKGYRTLGWQLLEAYGISENIIPMAMTVPGTVCEGSVGRPLSDNTIRIAPDGEVLVKGPGLAQETRGMLKEGYLSTGDLGRLDEHGRLHLLGRRHDMFKLSTGRKIIPGVIEQAVAAIPGIEYCVAAGMHRKYVVVLVNIPLTRWHLMCQQYGSEGAARRWLLHQVHEACRHLPAYSQPANLLVITNPFTVDTGELTSNQKLRRGYILKKYADAIAAVYRGEGDSIGPIPISLRETMFDRPQGADTTKQPAREKNGK